MYSNSACPDAEFESGKLLCRIVWSDNVCRAGLFLIVIAFVLESEEVSLKSQRVNTVC